MSATNGQANGHVATEPNAAQDRPGRPTCMTCVFWREPMFSSSQGQCRRSLETVKLNFHTYGAEFCGEHPDFPAFLAATRPAPSQGSKAEPERPSATMRPELREAMDANWDRSMEAYHYLAETESRWGDEVYRNMAAPSFFLGTQAEPEPVIVDGPDFRDGVESYVKVGNGPWFPCRLVNMAIDHADQRDGSGSTWIPQLEPDELRVRRRAAEPADTLSADMDAARLHGNYRRLYGAVVALLARPQRAVGTKSQKALDDVRAAVAALPKYDPFTPAGPSESKVVAELRARDEAATREIVGMLDALGHRDNRISQLHDALDEMTKLKSDLARRLHGSAMSSIAARQAVRDIVHQLVMTARHHVHDGNVQFSSLVVSAALLGKLERLAYGEPEPVADLQAGRKLIHENSIGKPADDDVIAPSFEEAFHTITDPADVPDKPAKPGPREVDPEWFARLDEAICDVVTQWPDINQPKEEFDATIDRLKSIRAEGHTAYVVTAEPTGPREIIADQSERIRRTGEDLANVRAKSAKRGQTIHMLNNRIAELRQANPEMHELNCNHERLKEASQDMLQVCERDHSWAEFTAARKTFREAYNEVVAGQARPDVTLAETSAAVHATEDQIRLRRQVRSFTEVIETGQRLFDRAGINLGWNEDTQRLFREHKIALDKWVYLSK